MNDTRTGGNDSVEQAQALILRARETMVVARSFLEDEGRLIPVMTCDDVIEKMLELLREVGA